MTDTKILPRRDLRVEAFRKYEPYIARACSQTLTIDPKKEMDVSPATFVARFRDAILAKKRFNYPSPMIPSDFDLTNLEANELEDKCHVLIKNKTEGIAPVAPKPITEDDVITIMKQIADRQRVSYDMIVSGGEELGRVLLWAKKHDEIDCIAIAQNGKAFFYTL